MARISKGSRKSKAPGLELFHTLYGHTNAISSVKFSPSGELLASCAYDKAIKIWDPYGGELHCNLIGHEQGASDIDWSTDSRLLVSASDDTNLKIWDVERALCVSTLKGHTEFVFSAKFSPFTDRIMSGSDDFTVKFWDVARGECVKTLNQHSDRVCAVDFVSEAAEMGNIALSASYDGNCYIYNADTYERIWALPTQDAGISFAKFSPNGKYVLVATLDDTITLWDVFNKDKIIKRVRQYKGHTNKIFSIFASFFKGGELIVSGSEDHGIYVWDIKTEEVVEIIREHTDVVLCVDCHPTEKMIATGALDMDKTVRIWKS